VGRPHGSGQLRHCQVEGVLVLIVRCVNDPFKGGSEGLPRAAFILGLTQHGPGGSFASGKKLIQLRPAYAHTPRPDPDRPQLAPVIMFRTSAD